MTVNPFRDLGDNWDAYIQTYDPKTDLTVEQQRRVIELCRLVTRASDADFAARIGTFIDLDAFARYYAVLVWINNIDSLLDRGQNFYLHEHPQVAPVQLRPVGSGSLVRRVRVRATIATTRPAASTSPGPTTSGSWRAWIACRRFVRPIWRGCASSATRSSRPIGSPLRWRSSRR